jgi:phosphonate degradation associated HDIG domain protein
MFEAQGHVIRDIFSSRAHGKYGLENISQLEHMLQTAWLAEQLNEPPAFVLAALLHDIGHLTADLGDNPADDGIDNHHENLGANWLAPRLPAAVSEPVRLHVEAKRYLCAIDPGYVAALAPDSVLSLRLQGGPMSPTECEAFLSKPFARDAVRLRRLDDQAKREDLSLPPLEHYLRHLSALKPDAVDRETRSAFHKFGFVVIRNFFTQPETQFLRNASTQFGTAAASQLEQAVRDGVTLANLAQRDPQSLIVVPEASSATQVCRFEYLLGSDPQFAQFVHQRMEPVLSSLHGEPFIPFKDKENEKHPGGGAFRPHQDFAAYQAFGPRYNATAMLTIDGQTLANGCVEFATNHGDVIRDQAAVQEWFEGRALLHACVGGPTNGDIREDIARRIEWQPVETGPADLVVFDSFVPHRSAENRTTASRRAMFITYAAQREGAWYTKYYDEKRSNYLDPKFHVSTPTRSAAVCDERMSDA